MWSKFKFIRYFLTRSRPRPAEQKAVARLAAEEAWLKFGLEYGVPVHVFRLGGIYGPGRSMQNPDPGYVTAECFLLVLFLQLLSFFYSTCRSLQQGKRPGARPRILCS
ncbi:unnamed protein product [Calypogeia fissa]